MDINVYIHGGDEPSPIERKLEEIMAQIDALQTQFDSLSTAVHSLMDRESAALKTLNDELDILRADETVENSKLEGITAAAAELQGAVEAFGTQAPPVEPPAPPVV